MSEEQQIRVSCISQPLLRNKESQPLSDINKKLLSLGLRVRSFWADPGWRGNSYSGKSSSVVNNGKKITENLRQIELQKKAGLDPLDLTGLFKMFSLSLKNNRTCWSYVAWWRIMIRFESWSHALAAVDGNRVRNGRNSTCPGAVDSTCVRMCVSVCVYALTFTHPVLPQRMWPPRISFRSSEEQLICTSTGRKTIL